LSPRLSPSPPAIAPVSMATSARSLSARSLFDGRHYIAAAVVRSRLGRGYGLGAEGRGLGAEGRGKSRRCASRASVTMVTQTNGFWVWVGAGRVGGGSGSSARDILPVLHRHCRHCCAGAFWPTPPICRSYSPSHYQCKTETNPPAATATTSTTSRQIIAAYICARVTGRDRMRG
jgi:hypothetical protein